MRSASSPSTSSCSSRRRCASMASINTGSSCARRRSASDREKSLSSSDMFYPGLCRRTVPHLQRLGLFPLPAALPGLNARTSKPKATRLAKPAAAEPPFWHHRQSERLEHLVKENYSQNSGGDVSG